MLSQQHRPQRREASEQAPDRGNDAALPSVTFPEEVRDLFAFLVPRGWYFSLHAPYGTILGMARALKEGDLDAVEAGMMAYGRQRLPLLLSRVEAVAPERCAVLRDAVAAHQAGTYSLSIPVMLAQADGLTRQVFGESLLTTRSEKAQTGTRSGGGGPGVIADSLKKARPRRWELELAWAAILGQLDDRSGLTVHSKEHAADPNWGTLNRHAVLHGQSVDYGTEANGLRAVVLLDFVCELIWQNGVGRQVQGQSAQRTTPVNPT
jgi:hypothetical protein